MGKTGAHRVLVGKPGGNTKLGSPRCICLDNIQMDLTETGCGGGQNACGSGHRFVVGSFERGHEPSGFIKLWNLCG
jgi:hypothetical protein